MTQIVNTSFHFLESDQILPSVSGTGGPDPLMRTVSASPQQRLAPPNKMSCKYFYYGFVRLIVFMFLRTILLYGTRGRILFVKLAHELMTGTLYLL